MEFSVFVVVALIAASGVVAAQDDVKNCTKAGPFCESCTSLVYCMQNGDGTWDKDQLDTCESPNICFHGECTEALDPECNNIDFPCTSAGTFPDPLTWTNYVMCHKDDSYGDLKGFSVSCPSCTSEDAAYGYGYNAKSGICDKKLDETSVDTYPVPACNKTGESAPLQDNPAFFYICKNVGTTRDVLYPVMHRCNCSTVFDESQLKCVPSGSNTTSSMEYDMEDDYY